jgi:hypothetical protein
MCPIVFESGIFPAEGFCALLVFTAIVNDLTIVLLAPMSAQIAYTIFTSECDLAPIEGTTKRVAGHITVGLGGCFGGHARPKEAMRRDSVPY